MHRRSVPVSARRYLATAAVLLLVGAGVLIAQPAGAVPDSTGPGVTDPPAPDTESTIVSMRDQGGVYGTAGESVTALTPYPSSPVGVSQPYETAQIVLQDSEAPGAGETLAYCIDIDTDTEIGVHYELGEWTEANVPNLEYVTYILQNNYPANDPAPGAPAAEKVEVVQAAIWYFTDQFVLGAAETQRPQVAAIVADAQANAQPQPPLPTLTLTPASAEGLENQLFGPFVAGGSAPTSVLGFTGVSVFLDAVGRRPLAPGASIPSGTSLWARTASAGADHQITLEAPQTVAAGNVFLYDGNNPGRSSAQKLIIAQDTTVTLRALTDITAFAAGGFELDVSVGGAAAGLQGDIAVTVTCNDAGAVTTRSATLPAGNPAGRYAIDGDSLRVGTVCTAQVTADGASAQATLASSAITPASVTIAAETTAVITVANVYAVPVPAPTPTPTPTPTPSPSRLANSGGAAGIPWGVPIGLVALGGVLVVASAVRRRRSA